MQIYLVIEMRRHRKRARVGAEGREDDERWVEWKTAREASLERRERDARGRRER